MPKTEVDWSRVALPPSPEVEHGQAIHETAAVIRGLIRDTNKNYGNGERLTGFADNSDPEDHFVRHAAMLKVLGGYGLLPAYYAAEAVRDGSPLAWRLDVVSHRPKGVFILKHAIDAETKIGRFTYFFKKGR